MLELHLQLAVALHLRRVCQIRLKLVHLLFHFRKPRNAAKRILQKRLFRRVGLGILARETDARIKLDDKLPRVRRHFTEDDFKKRGLTGPVRSYYSYAITLVYAE